MTMPTNYTPYHVHTMLSNGLINIDSIDPFTAYIDKAKELGMTAFGFAEHGHIFEWLKKKEYTENAGMKYIHAVEAYLTESLDDIVRDNYHCILIARNENGVCELNKLVSGTFNREDGHYYYVPRITFDELFATSHDIIITTACLGGVLNRGTTTAKERYLTFLAQNADRCYLEIQHHNCDEQIEYNRLLLDLSREFHIPLIAGTDAHAISERSMDGRAMLQKSKNVRFADEDSWDLVFKSFEELVEAYRVQDAIPMDVVYEAIENTNRMADSIIPFDVDRSPKYPQLYSNPEEVFKSKINHGVIARGIRDYPNYREYVDRIHYEYGVYKHNNAINFMLLEEDYKSEMRKRGIRFGYSRGSVSGSIIAYLLGITEIDSVKCDLNFDRFMNTERVSLADIDTDWYSADRGAVREYLFGKKGLYCCDIVTFNTIQLKGAIRDIGRAFDMPISEVTDICDNIAIDEEKVRAKYKKLFEYVDLVNGVVVSVGNHPAGCVVSPVPVDSWFGTFTTKTDQYPVSMLNMKEIDSLNFVKLDILGLDNIGLIYKTCDLAGIPFATPNNTPLDDLAVWNSIKEDTTMIFQWESNTATRYLKSLFSDETIAAIRERNEHFSYMDLFSIGNGAIRPAGESYRDKLAAGIYQDNGHEALNAFLAPTLGYLVYQEQVIEFLHKFCGYTMGEADIVRRGFAKKTGTEQYIPKIKSGFIKTMKEQYGVDEQKSEELIVNFLQVIQDASSYLFSKNHADPYSYIGYICGYLRYYYPKEFITTALNVFADDEKKSIAIVNYAKKNGFTISPIRFRHSGADYRCGDDKTIYKGIASIKYMNASIADELLALADNHYASFVDLLVDLKEKTTLDVRQRGLLIDLGFFAEFGDPNLLQEITSIFDAFYQKKNIKKDDVVRFSVSAKQMETISEKTTEKMYMHTDTVAFIRLATSNIKYAPRTLIETVKLQLKHLGYLDIADRRYDKMCVVMRVDRKYAPRLNLYSLKNGASFEAKMSRRVFSRLPLHDGDIIRITDSVKKLKSKRLEDGTFEQVPGTSELWINNYTIMKKI